MVLHCCKCCEIVLRVRIKIYYYYRCYMYYDCYIIGLLPTYLILLLKTLGWHSLA